VFTVPQNATEKDFDSDAAFPALAAKREKPQFLGMPTLNPLFLVHQRGSLLGNLEGSNIVYNSSMTALRVELLIKLVFCML
jgi:hypothetical protein